MTPGEEQRLDWRRGSVAAAIAFVSTMVLLGMVVLVAISNGARDRALQAERHAYDVTLLTRTMDASIARAEAAVGRYALDEDAKTSGSRYYAHWRLAGQQLNQLERSVSRDPEQRKRAEELRVLFQQRGQQFSDVARYIAGRQKTYGLSYFYSISMKPSAEVDDIGTQLRGKLSEIADAERAALSEKISETQFFSAEANRLTDYLSWLGVIVGLFGIFMGYVAVQALRQNAAARKEAESESERAQALELAVRDRTQELWEANQKLKAEAIERLAAEAQLRQVQKMEAVGQLTGGIAHDFNNMLAVVVGGIDLARRRLNGPRREIMTHLTNAMEGATRAAALTRRLLSFARSEPLMPERVDTAVLVGGMSELLDRTLGERIKVVTDLSGDAWPVFVDPHQLENAIVNLAVNARDAMEGTGKLKIRSLNKHMKASEVGDIRGGDYLCIEVTDTGCGMTPEVKERAFEPFFTTKAVGKGTGLGLSQIFGFAHQSGGEVGIESSVGKGTTVSIYLPRTDAEPSNVRAHPAMHARTEEDMTVPGARILLVEDDPRVRTATVGALEDLGYEPVACASGPEALALFDSMEFDLVISDVIMPEMTGPEMIRELKSRHTDIAVLFVTGYVGEGEGEDLIGYDLLRKPFTVSTLSSAVATALARTPRGAPTESRRSGGAAAAG
ncbi:response regulator [Sphingomonas sp. NSE70-1]|uniref:histidine kinase n=1 Tax=Sphingomonas caseinilyticus TaxID=2908205 RepID=A0ABT0RTS4_9SPHN|nr:ATP-binding protein [Sphingomonas caseinilyticus]MCL6698392.1 response regulator [Sphingomonas caseinilyticus]